MLRARLKPDAGVGEVAAAFLGQWRGVGRALDPIIGQRGTAALYQRSLQLTARAHPWLAEVSTGPLGSIDLGALGAAIEQQTVQRALAGGDALFETFCELLASVVGGSLAERLLYAVRTPSPGAAPQQDSPS